MSGWRWESGWATKVEKEKVMVWSGVANVLGIWLNVSGKGKGMCSVSTRLAPAGEATQTLVNLSRSPGTSDWRELTDKKSKMDKERIKQVQLGGCDIARKKTKLKLNMKKSRLLIRLREKENWDSIVSAIHETQCQKQEK